MTRKTTRIIEGIISGVLLIGAVILFFKFNMIELWKGMYDLMAGWVYVICVMLGGGLILVMCAIAVLLIIDICIRK